MRILSGLTCTCSRNPGHAVAPVRIGIINGFPACCGMPMPDWTVGAGTRPCTHHPKPAVDRLGTRPGRPCPAIIRPRAGPAWACGASLPMPAGVRAMRGHHRTARTLRPVDDARRRSPARRDGRSCPGMKPDARGPGAATCVPRPAIRRPGGRPEGVMPGHYSAPVPGPASAFTVRAMRATPTARRLARPRHAARRRRARTPMHLHSRSPAPPVSAAAPA